MVKHIGSSSKVFIAKVKAAYSNFNLAKSYFTRIVNVGKFIALEECVGVKYDVARSLHH